MGLKKKTDEISHKVADRIIFTRISKSTTSTINLLKARGIEITYLTILFLFAGGLVNGLIEGTSPLMQNYVIFPQRGIQTVTETLVYVFAMAAGTAGIYFLYMGGRQSMRRRISDFYVLIGFTAVLLAIALSLYIVGVKV